MNQDPICCTRCSGTVLMQTSLQVVETCRDVCVRVKIPKQFSWQALQELQRQELQRRVLQRQELQRRVLQRQELLQRVLQ